jgi:4-amino-4-deoxy-L-arabinose transferase-like glycosyltransferase
VDLNKLSTADKVIGASAILFLVALFMPWYGLGGGSNNGWDYFLTGILPLLLAAAMVAVIAIQRFTTTELPKPPIPWSQIHLIAGTGIVVLLLLRVLITSDVEVLGESFDLDRKFGLWIALIAAVGLGVGGYMKNQESEDAVTGPSVPPTAV